MININNLDKFSEIKLGGNKTINLKKNKGGGMVIIRPPYMVATNSNPSFRMIVRNPSIL